MNNVIMVAGFDDQWYEWYGDFIMIDDVREPTFYFEDLANQNGIDDGLGYLAFRDSAGFTWLWDGKLLTRSFPVAVDVKVTELKTVYEILERQRDAVNEGIETVRTALILACIALEEDTGAYPDGSFKAEIDAINAALRLLDGNNG